MTTSATSERPAAPAGTPPGGLPPTRLVKAELLKIWTTNSWWIFGILLVAGTGLTLLVNLFIANSQLNDAAELRAKGMPDLTGVDPSQQQIYRDRYEFESDIHRVLANVTANVFTSGQFFGLLFITVLGCLIVTNEYFHQTATTTFLATPHRTQVITSKLAAGAVLGVGFWLITTVINIVVGSIYFSSTGRDVLVGEWSVLRSVLLNLLAYVIWAILGIGLGVLLRSQLGATITAAVAYLLAIPVAGLFFGLIRAFVIKDDGVFNAMVLLPGVDSAIMVSPERIQLAPTVLGPPWWAGALVLLAYGVLAGAVGTVLTRRRDIS
jgi:ABC-type transport system involved in multi-copper enzyme maturation permease subunit